MRMAELSRESGLPVATIKFYLREGLLAPGERTSPNQARYSREHLSQLRLIRALSEVGGLSVAEVRAVLDAMGEGPFAALATAQAAMVKPTLEPTPEEDAWAASRYEELIGATGWRTWPDSAAAQQVRSVMISARRATGSDILTEWSHYQEQADAIAKADIDHIGQQADLAGTVSAAVAGTILGAAYFNALRMLAHQHHSGERFDGE